MDEPITPMTAQSSGSKRSADIHSLLEALIAKRLEEIADIEQMVERYERRVRMEEQAYRSMSTLRRMLNGKKPDHHLAVEYIHYVKKPLEKARLLREEVSRYESMRDGQLPADISDWTP